MPRRTGCPNPAKFAALSAGQAVAVAHVAAHDLGAAAYDIKAASARVPADDAAQARATDREWQRANSLPLSVNSFSTINNAGAPSAGTSSTKATIGRPELRVHDLRHTAASMWLASGADPKVVQRVLGHATAAMTMDLYGHMIDRNLWDTAQRLGGATGARPDDDDGALAESHR
jgi:integrase